MLDDEDFNKEVKRLQSLNRSRFGENLTDDIPPDISISPVDRDSHRFCNQHSRDGDALPPFYYLDFTQYGGQATTRFVLCRRCMRTLYRQLEEIVPDVGSPTNNS